MSKLHKEPFPNWFYVVILRYLERRAKDAESNSRHTYKRAADGILKHDDPLDSKKCLGIPGIGKNIANALEVFLEAYRTAHPQFNEHVPLNPDDIEEVEKWVRAWGEKHIPKKKILPREGYEYRSEDDENTDSSQKQSSKRLKSEEYMPKPHSGGWALLVALVKNERDSGLIGASLGKAELIKKATPYSETSFVVAEIGFYTAWSSMKTLREKNLVEEVKRKYVLTEDGRKLANQLAPLGQLLDTFSSQVTTPDSNSSGGGKVLNRSLSMTAAGNPTMIIGIDRDKDRNEVAQLHFWYLDIDFRRTTEKAKAFLQRSNRSVCVEFHEYELLNLLKLPNFLVGYDPTPDCGGFYRGFVRENVAPDACHGIEYGRVAAAGDQHHKQLLTQGQQPIASKLPPLYPGLFKNEKDKDNSFLEDSNDEFYRSDWSSGGEEGFGEDSGELLSSSTSASSSSSLPKKSREAVPEEIVFRSGTFEIILIIDNREKRKLTDRDFFQRELVKRGVKVETRALVLGDMLWIARQKSEIVKSTTPEIVLGYIVERKRMDDLATSIKDTRYREQKLRLANSGLDQVVYIVENDNKGTYVQEENRLRKAMVDTIMNDHFFLKQTENAHDTVSYLTTLNKKITELMMNKTLIAFNGSIFSVEQFKSKRQVFQSRNPNQNYLMSYRLFCKLSMKSRNYCVKDLWAQQLLQMQGIGIDRAIPIVTEFPTPQSLCEVYKRVIYENGDDSLAESLLAPLKHLNAPTRVGSSISKKVFELLWSDRY